MKYVIFDFGQVLVHFEPSYMVGKYVKDPVDAEVLAHVVFDRLYWDALDAGTMTDATAVAGIRSRLPERLGDVAQQIYYNWIYNIPEVQGMRELIGRIKQKYGASVYVLSNISTYFAEHAQEISILDLVDGCVFSAVCGMTKPNLDIFEHICEMYGLDPAQGVFVDDRAENVAAAKQTGLQGYVFDGSTMALSAYLDQFFNSKQED